jgi:hypothetical protein
MRKHKSVVAILLAVMMIFTFMPAMSFAYSTVNADGSTIDWGDTLGATTATYTSDGTSSTCDVKYSVANATTGLIKASASVTKNGVTKPVGEAYFFDLTGATVYKAGALVKGNYDYNHYTDLYTGALSVKLARPSYIKETEWKDVDPQERLDGDTTVQGNTRYTFAADGKADETAAKGETKTINVKITAGGAPATGDESHPYLLGATPSASVTITDGSDAAAAGAWYVDTASKSNVYSDAVGITYDGKEHTLIYVAPDNASVSYEKYDSSRNVWNSTGAITVKNANAWGRTNIADRYRAVFKDKHGNTHTSDIGGALNQKQKFLVHPTTKTVKFGFKPMPGLQNTYNYELTAEEAADPVKFVTSDKVDKCVAGDEDALMSFFNDFYEIKVSKNASNANQQRWDIVEKEAVWYPATAAETKAQTELLKKHGTLLANYGLVSLDAAGNVSIIDDDLFEAEGTALVKIDTAAELNTKTDDITFTGVTTKAFKAKKKTKKLAKAKTFQVVAKADSGNAITFSATSSNGKVSIDETGVVTVKKGLKKGAKVKLVVKAKTAAGNGYKAASAEKTYTIKIK